MTPKICQKIESITIFAIILAAILPVYFIIQKILFPDSSEESNQYLYKNGVEMPEIHRASLSSFKVGETPTLILLNDNGKVSISRVGKLFSVSERIGQLSFFTFKRIREIKV